MESVGFEFMSTITVTTRTIAVLCDALEKEFGSGHTFCPDKSHDGGIRLLSWPILCVAEECKINRPPPVHQQLIFRFRVDASSVVSAWPFIEDPMKTRRLWMAEAHPTVLWTPPRFDQLLYLHRTPIAGNFIGAVYGRLSCKTADAALLPWIRRRLELAQRAFEAVGFYIVPAGKNSRAKNSAQT